MLVARYVFLSSLFSLVIDSSYVGYGEEFSYFYYTAPRIHGLVLKLCFHPCQERNRKKPIFFFITKPGANGLSSDLEKQW